jgi:predicted transcriptional regulator
MNQSSLPPITDTELRVLEALWNRGESAIRELRDALYPQGGSSKFATVHTLLSRLVAKNLVRRRKDGSNWFFQAAVARDELIGEELRRVADRLGADSLAPLLTCLVEAGGLSAKERAHLRKLLEDPGTPRRRA